MPTNRGLAKNFYFFAKRQKFNQNYIKVLLRDKNLARECQRVDK